MQKWWWFYTSLRKPEGPPCKEKADTATHRGSLFQLQPQTSLALSVELGSTNPSVWGW